MERFRDAERKPINRISLLHLRVLKMGFVSVNKGLIDPHPFLVITVVIDLITASKAMKTFCNRESVQS